MILLGRNVWGRSVARGVAGLLAATLLALGAGAPVQAQEAETSIDEIVVIDRKSTV